jgi:three-Cys-motif partner protein
MKNGMVVKTSALLALSADHPFTDYYFCEKDPELYRALETRIKKEFASANVHLYNGDCNIKIDNIILDFPSPYKQGVLFFCFLDPFNLSIQFDTINKLSRFRMDFLVLYPTGMDIRRNRDTYIRTGHEKISKFLNNATWNEYIKGKHVTSSELPNAIYEMFCDKMIQLGYILKCKSSFHAIKSSKNIILFHLAFFSRNERGYGFWEKTIKTLKQTTLF